MAIAKHKHRYILSLTRTNIERFRSLCKELGLPETTLSNAVDDLIPGITEVLQLAKDKGEMAIHDISRLMGKQMDLLHEEERKHEERQKRNPNIR